MNIALTVISRFFVCDYQATYNKNQTKYLVVNANDKHFGQIQQKKEREYVEA